VQRFQRTATNIIVVLTAAAWVLTALAGYSEQAAYALGFIPLRMTQAVAWPAVPAFLTPLTATLALDPMGTTPMVGASGAISAVMGAFALSFGRARPFTSNLRVNRWINVIWLLIAWIVLQMMMAWLAGWQGYLLATPAHVGGFAAGLLLQRPLLLWRYRSA
jgi:membrane associated rhomboid family serine protease